MNGAPAGPTLWGGRLWIGALLLGGTGIGMNEPLDSALSRAFSAPQRSMGNEAWRIGSEALLQLTLITADASRLDCADDTVIGGSHCAYRADLRPWPRSDGPGSDTNGNQIIKPYRTAGTNALVYVMGLWDQPELALRVHYEPPDVYPSTKLLRFVAECRVKFVGELKSAAVRWDPTGQWQRTRAALVATPLHCTLPE